MELKITNMLEDNKHLKSEVKPLLESIEFQSETYEKMKKIHDGSETKTRN